MALAAGQPDAANTAPAQTYIAPLGAGMNVPAAKLARELRAQGVRLELGDESFRLKKAFETAEKMGIAWIVIVGETEVAADQFSVKDLKTGTQTQVAREALAATLAQPSNQ
jgi:histidyl-tRNA synthetase